MADDVSLTCVECKGSMAPIIIMDKRTWGPGEQRNAGVLEYRLPEDRASFWMGKYPTAGSVRAFMCQGCGRIALYGGAADA